MSEKDLTRQRNIVASLVRSSNRFGSQRNAIRLNPANTWEHEQKKVEICWQLLKIGAEFYTEAIFKNGSRCDILVLYSDDCCGGKIIEILNSETEEQCQEKIKKYPRGIEVEMIKVD